MVGSNNNHINGNIANDNGREGIVVVTGGSNNHVNGNTALRNGRADLQDSNLDCDNNTWNSNVFGTKLVLGGSTSDACIS